MTISSPIIAIIFVYFFNIKPLKWFSSIFNDEFFSAINKDATAFMINQAIIVFIINLILETYRHFGKFSINIQNKDRQNTTYLPLSGQSQKSRVIDIDVKLNYRMLLIKKLFNLIGGLKLYIHIPHWLTLTIRNKDNFKLGTFDDSKLEYIAVDLNNTIQMKKESGKIYIETEILSGATAFVEDEIICEIKPSSNYKLCRGLGYILIFLLFEIEEKHHSIVSTRMK